MFGFEFSALENHNVFPIYDNSDTVNPDCIENLLPLVWQEHCVEYAMPACYGTCLHYKRRIDGRCKLFNYGIERIENKQSILGQNVIIDMRSWAKLETFFFTAPMPYKRAEKYNSFYCNLAKIAQCSRSGKIKRVFYYIKEYISRRSGYSKQSKKNNQGLPRFFLCEIMNNQEPYSLILENRAGSQIVYRTAFRVKTGYNRYWLTTDELNYQKNCQNNLCLYPEENKPQKLNIISLEILDIKAEYIKTYFPNSNKKVKLVIWDLDNTLWKGILSEDGIERIELNIPIMEIIKELDGKGIINSIASKNEREDTLKALEYFKIDKYFVAPMINGNPKSENIKAIAKNLDLGMDTFVFVDDTSNELQEVQDNCSGVRVCDVKNIFSYIRGDAFDVPVTEESKHRRESYKEISIRNADALQYKDDITRFLLNCKMAMYIAHPTIDEQERCYELLQRTNQLNISAERLSKKELSEILSDPCFDCYRIKVEDRYGNYGLVGFAVFDIHKKHLVELKHFVFSCRAARKRLEQSFFEYMIDQYYEKGYQKLKLYCKKTEKNKLMQTVLMESRLFEKINESNDSFELIASIDQEHVRSGIVSIYKE